MDAGTKLICPKCARRAMRGGMCLQCGFRGEGTAQMTREQRLNASKPKKTDDRGEPHSTGSDWSWVDLDAGSDCA